MQWLLVRVAPLCADADRVHHEGVLRADRAHASQLPLPWLTLAKDRASYKFLVTPIALTLDLLLSVRFLAIDQILQYRSEIGQRHIRQQP